MKYLTLMIYKDITLCVRGSVIICKMNNVIGTQIYWWNIGYDFDGSAQDCRKSSVLAMKLLQSWTEPLT